MLLSLKSGSHSHTLQKLLKIEQLGKLFSRLSFFSASVKCLLMIKLWPLNHLFGYFTFIIKTFFVFLCFFVSVFSITHL